MSDGIYTALNAALGETTNLDIVATNLANAATVGYQRLRPVFHEALANAQAGGAGLQRPAVTTTQLDSTPGAIRVTGRPLDVTLPAGTFLSLGTTRGERYTRAGALTVAVDGTLQTRSGEPVLSDAGKRIVASRDAASPTISADGEVVQEGIVLARLKLVSFNAPTQLTAEGAAVLAANAGSGPAAMSGGQLSPGTLEESNTTVVGSMTELVSASRAFDAFQKAIDAFRQADQKVTTTVPNADQ
jgi:flagellar basal body rod protein FlgG